MSEWIVGIDLGTTNSEIAIYRDGRVQVIPISDGQPILPSYVGLGEDDALLVGEPAKNQYILYPERTIKSIKRQMGSDTTVVLGEQSYSPQEISAMILRRLKAVAEDYLQTAITKAVITVPAYFSDAQRQATREAGEIAGLEVVRIINEPTAAALAYQPAQHGQRRVLVYDLGGGTFDVSVVSMENEVVEVLASHGDNHLGGDDFDGLLVEHIEDHLHKLGIELQDNRRARARIIRAAETAKIALSDQPFVRIEEEYLLEDNNGSIVNLSLEISREDYEALIESLVDRTIDAVHQALNDASLSLSDIDEVLMVGGATRTPMIQNRLRDDLGLTVHAEIDPDLCVATGAAVQAAIHGGHDVSAILVDVTPYTFGTSALGELNGMFYPLVYVPIIHKNTPIPVTKSESFYTSYDNQSAVQVHIYQGEDPDAAHNIEIGEFRVEGLSAVPEGNPIVMTFSLDLDGILQVTAVEKNTGQQKSIRIDNAISRFQDQAMVTAKQRVAALFSETADTTPSQDNTEATKAKALIDRAETLLDGLDGDDRNDLINALEAIKEALAQGEGLDTALEALNDMLFYLEP